MADVFSEELFVKPLKQGELVLHESEDERRRFVFVLKALSLSWYEGVVPLLEGEVYGRYKLAENTEVVDWTKEGNGLALHSGDGRASLYLTAEDETGILEWKARMLEAIEDLKIKAISLQEEVSCEGLLNVLQFDLEKGEWEPQKLYFVLHNEELTCYNSYPNTLSKLQNPRGVIHLSTASRVSKVKDAEFTFKLTVDSRTSVILAAAEVEEETKWLRVIQAAILRLDSTESTALGSKKMLVPQLSQISDETEVNKMYVIPEKDASRFGEIMRDTAERKKFVEKKMKGKKKNPVSNAQSPSKAKKDQKVWRRLFLWGSSAQGELCSPVLSHSNVPELVKGFKKRLQAKDLQLGETFGAILTQEESQVFVWGRSPLGVGEVRLNSPQLVRALHDVKVSKISCGGSHMAAISEDGQLYTWGRGVKGELGLGPKNVCVSEPVAVEMNNPVVSVDCGLEHTLMLVKKEASHSTTAVFACGSHSSGKLGLAGQVEHAFVPVEIETLCHENIVLISAGRTFSMAASERTCFHWGKIGQHRNVTPTRLEKFASKILQVCAGNNFGMILCQDSDGKTVYSYGGASYLLSNGVGKVSRHLHPIDALGNYDIIQVSCGKKHAAALSSDGTLLCWGSNSAGQLGNGYSSSLGRPYESVQVLSYKYSHLACGGNTTGALAEYKENHEESEMWELRRPPEPPLSYHVHVNNPTSSKLPERLITTLKRIRS